MPHAPVNNSGAVLYYEDSGAPTNSSCYTTLVILHGLIFHGAGFRPLFQHANAHNMRIITVNLRDYPGSTPYDQMELDALLSEDISEQEDASRAQGLEIAAFLKHITISEKLPLAQRTCEGVAGGIVLLAWSLGNVHALSMLGNEQYFDGATTEVLRRVLRTVVLYETPYTPLGVCLPDELAISSFDPSLSPEELTTILGHYISSFFTAVPSLNVDVHTLASRLEMSATSADPRYIPTVEQIGLEDLQGLIEPHVLERSASGLLTTRINAVIPAWRGNAKHALFDCDPSSQLAHVNAVVLCGDMSCSMFPFVANYISEQLEAASATGKTVRPTTFVKVEGVNHFFHWHDPDRFLRTVVTALRG